MNHTHSRVTRSCLLALLGSVLLLLQIFSACKKVDEHAALIEAQPFISTSGYELRSNYIVGDTVTLAGRLFLNRPDTRITLGNVPVVIVQKDRVITFSINDRTGKRDSMDVCRFLITKDMAGVNLPLTVIANGYTAQGPLITVQFINSGDRRTDTTLIVDRLGAWLPANVSAFRSIGSTLVNNSSVAGDGTIYFDNLNGIFQLANRQVSTVLSPGNTLTDQLQHSFTIDAIISSVISPDGNTLYFSSINTENAVPTADTLYVTRLCAMSRQTQKVITLNRTTLKKGIGTYTEDPRPYNGNIGAVKIVAHNLHMDINGNLFFTNYYFPEKAFKDPDTGRQYNSTVNWYSLLKKANNSIDNDNILGALTSVCRLDNTGQVTSLVQTNLSGLQLPSPYTTPGTTLSDVSHDFLLSPDGNLLYGMKFLTFLAGYGFGLNQYDLNQQDIENTYSYRSNNFLFISYDTATATKIPSRAVGAPCGNASLFNSYLVLPNNDILLGPSRYAFPAIPGKGNISLFAYNMNDKTMYCYAGTEKQDNKVQNQETGNAKFVNFQGDGFRFCGMDRQGSVYYCIGGNTDFTKGVKFYKLHRKGI